jgi:hypothetical protein
MSDLYDNASELEALQREISIKAIRKKKTTFTGYCRYCNATIELGSFCSVDCRESQELEDELKKVKGFF